MYKNCQAQYPTLPSSERTSHGFPVFVQVLQRATSNPHSNFQHVAGRASAACWPFPGACWLLLQWLPITADMSARAWSLGALSCYSSLVGTSLSPARFGVHTSTHLHLFLILESSFAHNDVFNTSSITELLLKDGIVFKEFLGLLLWNSIQGILVDHSYPFKLKADRRITSTTQYSHLSHNLEGN